MLKSKSSNLVIVTSLSFPKKLFLDILLDGIEIDEFLRMCTVMCLHHGFLPADVMVLRLQRKGDISKLAGVNLVESNGILLTY